MMLIIINSLIITLFISCLTMLSPISLGATVLCIAVFVASSLTLMSTGWFGLITFIIYVGGMLVMFAYFAALQPNQHITNWSQILTPSFFFIIMYASFQSSPIMWKLVTPDTAHIYSTPNTMLPIIMAMILFLALIMVVKTSRAHEGPLRPFQYV
uniref:NADH-ubiquinone oxidoreductase chain 6 n=1 Tax=Hediste diversicolor TaxID=126592 RepID=A0A7T8G3W8_HEDDI|nr:NADH dehydrogenase subunit 6 [Hediste diversicolor]QQP21530.1 NADH dehydrogenase subunit 6 [Hediste diversicolor]